MDKRAAGILMPITSLPSEYGIGCFSKSAYDFVDWLKEAGQSYWQILPLGPTSYGDSPYQSFSTFAGNPYFISLKALVEEGVLTKEDCDKVSWGRRADSVDYEKSTKAVTSFSAKLTKTATSARIRIIRNLLQKTAGGFPTMHFLWQ